MRLRLHATDRLPFWLIGDPALNERTELSQTNEERLQISRDQRAISGAEWDVKEFIDAKNNSVIQDFAARREFASEIARMDFITTLCPILESDSVHAWSGAAYLRLNTPGTDDFKEWLLPQVTLSLTGIDKQGACGLILNYKLSAGGFDLTGTRTGTQAVYLTAAGTRSGTCQMLLYLTTSGGAFDTAATVFAGTAPASLSVGNQLTLNIGDNNGTVTQRIFEVVAPGGSASGGRIAIETPVIDNLSVITTAFAGIANITASLETVGGRDAVFLAWTADPVADPEDVVIVASLSTGYESGSTAAAYNIVRTPGVWLTDADGVYLIADHFAA